MSSVRTVLITRPTKDAGTTARLVAAMGFEPVLAPMLTIRALPVRLPVRVDAVLLTSRNALPGLPTTLHAAPLLAVGAASAAAARVQGFADVWHADGDAAALRALVGERMRRGAVLLLASGQGQGTELAAALRLDGYMVHRRTAYVAVPAPVPAANGVRRLPRRAARGALLFGGDRAGLRRGGSPAGLGRGCARS